VPSAKSDERERRTHVHPSAKRTQRHYECEARKLPPRVCAGGSRRGVGELKSNQCEAQTFRVLFALRHVSSKAEKALAMLHCLLEGGEGLGKVTLSPRRRRRPRQGYTVSSKAEKASARLHCLLEGGEGGCRRTACCRHPSNHAHLRVAVACERLHTRRGVAPGAHILIAVGSGGPAADEPGPDSLRAAREAFARRRFGASAPFVLLERFDGGAHLGLFAKDPSVQV